MCAIVIEDARHIGQEQNKLFNRCSTGNSLGCGKGKTLTFVRESSESWESRLFLLSKFLDLF